MIIRVHAESAVMGPRYTGATLKCPVLGRFRLTMAERGWTRQNGPAIGQSFATKDSCVEMRDFVSG
jgi:hypothetical protein